MTQSKSKPAFGSDAAGLSQGSMHQPQVNPFAAELFDLIQAPIRWQLVQFSLEQQVFDQLLSPLTANQLADRMGWQPDNTERYLNAMSSMALLSKKPIKPSDTDNTTLVPDLCLFELSDDSRRLLTRNSPEYLGHTLLHMARTRHHPLDQMEQLLTGEFMPSDTHKRMDQESFWQQASLNLLGFHQSVASRTTMTLLTQLPQWPDIHHILDLAGGSESLAQHIQQAFPEKHVSLLELPACAQQIARRTEHPSSEEAPPPPGTDSSSYNRPCPDRLIYADYNQWQPDQRYDLIWCSMTLYYAKALPRLLNRLLNSLNPGGLLISFHEGLTEHRTQPMEHVTGRLMPAMQGQDLSFNHNDIAEAMRKAGFDSIESQTIQTCYGQFQMDIARTSLRKNR